MDVIGFAWAVVYCLQAGNFSHLTHSVRTPRKKCLILSKFLSVVDSFFCKLYTKYLFATRAKFNLYVLLLFLCYL